MNAKKITKIFIANRGEICRRIGLAARKLNIGTSTIVDRKSPPLYLMDCLTDPIFVDGLKSQHYLDGEHLIALARERGCDAIHPGYGYLSENFQFAEKVIQSGMIWIGPHPKSMDQMASKATSRDIAESESVPCLKALRFQDLNDVSQRHAQLESFAEEIGYPVLIKAALGGGGKGMRIVYEKKELLNAAERASSEAVSSFGNAEIIVEKYVENPRHVEVQILADKHGQQFAIGDRDCSVQRRHQKIIEEAPAPGLTDKTRKALHDAAVRLAKAVDYDSVGTVEFLLDWSVDKRNLELQSFYFLEMNTRLQVEHPVTEECYGIDLVEWQIRVAEGCKLPATFADLPPNGHAAEFRIYAEDCDQNFMPAPGPIDFFKPDFSRSVRWDVGLDTCDQISPEFDPMIAKLIVRSDSREKAFKLGLETLQGSAICGTKTNQEFLIAICNDEEFLSGAVSTSYLKEKLEYLQEFKRDQRNKYKTVVQELSSWLQNSSKPWIISNKSVNQSRIEAYTSDIYSTAKAKTDANSSGIIPMNREVFQKGRERVAFGRILIEDTDHRSVPYYCKEYPNFYRYGVVLSGHTFLTEVQKSGLDKFAGGRTSENSAVSPVPGKVVAIHYDEGDKVSENEVLIILESMKMEFEVKADAERVIDKLLVRQGEQVESGAVLVTWRE